MDNFVFKILKIDTSTMTWKKYAMSLLMVNLCLVFIGYLILRIQSIGFLNPNGISGMEESLSFNTIISFMTNTNLIWIIIFISNACDYYDDVYFCCNGFFCMRCYG